MGMNKRDRMGLIVLIGTFVILGLLLFFTVERPTAPLRDLENNVIVERRIKALESRQ